MALGHGDARLGWIYLVSDGGAFLHVGYARHPGQPLRSFVPSGRTPNLVGLIPGAKREEAALHVALRPAAYSATCYERVQPCVARLLDRLALCQHDHDRRNVLLDTIGALNTEDEEAPESPMASQSYPMQVVASHTLAMKVQCAMKHARLSRAGLMRLALNYYADLLLALPAEDAVKIGGAVGHGGRGMDAVALSTPRPPTQHLPTLTLPPPPPAAPMPTLDLSFLMEFAPKFTSEK